ncbi:MAG: hypothetical protein JWM07_308 [Candidatus Saccharibacteria bacterium]|jgi:hypothetical protein|nr:hypothetical protein [Candidatus Saccharibacteria bacterium]
MFAQSWRRLTSTIAVGFVSIVVLAGCNGQPVTVTPPSIGVPTVPPINIDMTKSLDEQVAELKAFYCKFRMTPIAEGVTSASKEFWNRLVQNNQGVAVPTFDPNDPNTCNGI